MQELILKIKKLSEDATIPSYAKEGDAGLDFTATKIEEFETFYEYSTGIAVEIPPGHVGLMFPRSSISRVNQVLTNAVGVIDSGYRGEVKFRFRDSRMPLDQRGLKIYEVGEKIGQLIVVPIPQVTVVPVTELSSSERGSSGFGSSGQ